jgi:hypothetical protein
MPRGQKVNCTTIAVASGDGRYDGEQIATTSQAKAKRKVDLISELAKVIDEFIEGDYGHEMTIALRNKRIAPEELDVPRN